MPMKWIAKSLVLRSPFEKPPFLIRASTASIRHDPDILPLDLLVGVVAC